jgi:1,4-dihydroxy-2-naphthoate octaprenyltransferase
MFSRSSWLHIRIPFSFFLLPIFFFALALSPNLNQSRLLWVLCIVHLLLYPASNGFNSYFDKDEKSIGGLKNPPPVKKGLYYLALLFDALAILLGALMVNLTFALMLFIYGLASKAYSHPSIRLKKYPLAGWLLTGFFQGFFMVLTCFVGINNFELETALSAKILAAGALATIMLWGNYPMTQIYQHEEDAKRGDITLSLKLGILGTFHFTIVAFGVATLGFIWFFGKFYNGEYTLEFLTFLSPVIVYFLYWYFRVRKSSAQANYGHTMWLNFISALCLNIFFIYFFLDASSILNIFIQ